MEDPLHVKRPVAELNTDIVDAPPNAVEVDGDVDDGIGVNAP